MSGSAVRLDPKAHHPVTALPGTTGFSDQLALNHFRLLVRVQAEAACLETLTPTTLPSCCSPLGATRSVPASPRTPPFDHPRQVASAMTNDHRTPSAIMKRRRWLRRLQPPLARPRPRRSKPSWAITTSGDSPSRSSSSACTSLGSAEGASSAAGSSVRRSGRRLRGDRGALPRVNAQLGGFENTGDRSRLPRTRPPERSAARRPGDRSPSLKPGRQISDSPEERSVD